MFDKKRLRKILVIIALVAVIIGAIILIRNTLARYETTATSQKDVDAAFWVVDNSFKSDRILLKDIYPSKVTYDYTFTVSNFKDETHKAETDLTYDIVLTASTNLPLEYEIHKNGVKCTKVEELIKDGDGTYYKQIKIETEANALEMKQGVDKTDTFVLKVTFPEGNNTNAAYSDLIEYVKIDLTAKQVI